MHAEAYRWFDEQLSRLPAPRRVLEVGSRGVGGGSLRSLFAFRSVPPLYLGIDVAPGTGVDVVASGEDFAPPWVPDMVLCAEVLEHVPDDVARRICQHALALLPPGGPLLMSMATDPREPHSAHGGEAGPGPGEYYRNVSVAHLTDWLAGASVEWWQHERGDLYVLARRGTRC